MPPVIVAFEPAVAGWDGLARYTVIALSVTSASSPAQDGVSAVWEFRQAEQPLAVNGNMPPHEPPALRAVVRGEVMPFARHPLGERSEIVVCQAYTFPELLRWDATGQRPAGWNFGLPLLDDDAWRPVA